jgi:glyoxylase-like metal-dependent hydrolase (beta-lactamase superfamily II)
MRGSLGVLFAGSVVVGIAALLSTDSFSVWRALWSAPSAPFTPLAGNDVLARPGLFVLGTTHKVPTFTFLVRYENEYILIDAGSPGRREHSDDLLAAVGKAVKGGNLRLLLITHGHIDHVGALPDLLTAFPNLQVVFHANEEPYIAGAKCEMISRYFEL